MMKKAMEAIYEQDVLQREVSTNIFAVDSKQLPKFKEKLREFRREFEVTASQDKNKNEVYCLSTQFYKLTKKEVT
jgi:hypothetical protein